MLMMLLGCAPPPIETACVDDVPAAFEAIDPTAVEHRMAAGGLFAGSESYRYTLTLENSYGIDNHWQGLARMGSTLFVSGGDAQRDHGDVIYGDLEEGCWQGFVPLDEGLEWHAGGLDLHDGVLAVPTENLRADGDERTSSLRLFDVSEPAEAVPLQVIERGGGTIAHAAGLAALGDGFVLLNWNDRELELYHSVSAVLHDGFEQTPFATVPAGDATGQSVSLVNSCDGGLFALMGDNTSDLPTDSGTNYVDLYEIAVSGDEATLEQLGRKEVQCPAEQGCNFRAAGGAWTDADGALWVGSVPLYRESDP